MRAFVVFVCCIWVICLFDADECFIVLLVCFVFFDF